MHIHDDETRNALQSAVSETFENVAFAELTGFSPQTQVDTIPEDTIATQVDIVRPHPYRLLLVLEKSYATELLGLVKDEDNPLSDDELWDIVKELINVIAGRFIVFLHPDSQDTKIGIPDPIVDVAGAIENYIGENAILCTGELDEALLIMGLSDQPNAEDGGASEGSGT